MDTEVANKPEIISDLSIDISKISLLADKDEDSNLTSEELARQLEIENMFRSNLNEQLLEEYCRYAAEEFPKNPEKQRELIEQMQDDYFTHYMQNIHHSMLLHQKEQTDFLLDIANSEEKGNNAQDIKMMPLVPARIWTRLEIATFKKEILSTSKECCIKIGSLSTATISVPTHADGATVWWEFATDNYDLGFGLFFEWSANPSDHIVVTISDSDDDEEDCEKEDLENGVDESGSEDENINSQEVAFAGDPESGPRKRRHRRSSELPTDELIPIIRRDCHQKVYCGQHQYPGQGRYLFKFDNSFSLIRSKWLYYRVYYSKE